MNVVGPGARYTDNPVSWKAPHWLIDAHLSTLFPELPYAKRAEAAGAAGVGTVETWWPFESPRPSRWLVASFINMLAAANVQLVSINLDAGDLAHGDRGSLSIPTRRTPFLANLEVALRIVEATGCRTINALWGNRQPDLRPEAQMECALANLEVAATAADRIGVQLVLEVLNPTDNPLFGLASAAAGLAAASAARGVGLMNVRLLCDVYQLTAAGEPLTSVIRDWGSLIGHVHLADHPDRREPGTGTIDFDASLAALREVGYSGYMGLEYHPTGPTEESVDRVRGRLELWTGAQQFGSG